MRMSSSSTAPVASSCKLNAYTAIAPCRCAQKTRMACRSFEGICSAASGIRLVFSVSPVFGRDSV